MRQLKQTIFLLVILQFIGSYAFAAEKAGKVIFSSGINKVINSAGKSRVVRRGDTVRSGDRLKTTTGRMQVRFSDNGFVSIKPRSELLIQKYRYNDKEDGKENAIFSLLKGSIRAISGVIGKKNKKAYQYKTPVATIGIRGTAFVLNYCNRDCFDKNGKPIPDGLYVNNGEGKIIVTSNGGSIDLTPGQFAYVRDSNSRPNQIRRPPSIRERIRNRIERYDVLGNLIVDDTGLALSGGNTNVTSRSAVSHGRVGADPLVFIDTNERDYNFRSRLNNTTYDGDTVVAIDNNGRLRGFADDYQITGNDGLDFQLINSLVTSADATGEFDCSAGQETCWGIWQTGWTFSRRVINNVTGEESLVDSDDPLLFSYIYSNNLTPLVDTFIDGISPYRGVSGTVSYGSKTNPVVNGLVAFVPGNAASGAEAIFGTQTVFMEIDFDNAMLNDLEIRGTFDGNGPSGQFVVDLASGPQSFLRGLITGTGGNTGNDLQGVCDASLCGAGNTNLGTGGVTRPEFVGANAEQLIASYAFGFGSAFEALIVGNALLDANTTTPMTPATTGIRGVAVASSGLLGSTTLISRGLSANTEDGSLLAVNLDAGNANITNFSVDDSIRDTDALPASRTVFTDALNLAITTPPPTAAFVEQTSQGNDDALSVSWGYWVNDYQFQDEVAAEEYDTDTFPLHFVYSDNITPDATIQALIAANTTVTYDNFIGGNVSYQDAFSGAPFVSGTLSGAMTVNFGASNIDAFSLTANFTSGSTDTIQLGGQGLGIGFRSFDVQTAGGGCNVCGTTSAVNGQANYEFVGSNADGVIGSFNLSDGVQHSVTGSFVIGQ